MLGILCGLESEAAIARKVVGSVVACTAARPQKARWLARDMVKKGGVTRLLSFGVAGGLETGLPIGSVTIGTQVMSTDGTWNCDKGWVNRLSQQLPEAHCGPVWGSETLIPTSQEKHALYQKSHCLVVDMESQCAAQIAEETKVPFAVVRVICDAPDMNVPPLVMTAIDDNGKVRAMKALLSILGHPGQIPDLFRLAKGTRQALRMMKASVPGITRST